MNGNQIKELFRSADQYREAGRLDEAEANYLALLAGLPRDDTGRNQRIRAYECVVDIQIARNSHADAMRVFRQYLGDCAPKCDPAYDAVYCDGLLATQTSPAPLKRRERFYALANMLDSCLRLQGLVAECGCYRGLSSFVLCRHIKLADGGFDGTGYRIFDSFAGLSEPQAEDAIDSADPNAFVLKRTTQRGRFAAGLDQVREALREFPGIGFYPGWIPDAFPDEPESRYRFVHLDVDLYQPTRDALEYFYPRLLPGGTLVCDDYDWPGARKAITDHCAQVQARFSLTPYNQAYIVRRA